MFYPIRKHVTPAVEFSIDIILICQTSTFCILFMYMNEDLGEILQKFSNDCSWQVAKHVNKIDNQLQLSVHIQHNTNHVNYQITHRLTDCFIIIRADCLLSLIIWHINSSKLFYCKWHIFDMMYAVLVFHSQKCQFLKVTTKKSPLMVLLTSIVIYMRMLTQLRI